MDIGDGYETLELLCHICLAEGEDGPSGWEEGEYGWVCPECLSEVSVQENEGLAGIAAALGQAEKSEKGE